MGIINKILCNVAQSLSDAQKAQARTNIGAAAALPSYNSSTSQKILTVDSAGNLVWQLRTGYLDLGSHYKQGGGATTWCLPVSDFGNDLIGSMAPLANCVADGQTARYHILNDTYDYIEVNFRMRWRWADGNNIADDYIASRTTQFTPPASDHPAEIAVLDTTASSLVGDSTIYSELLGNSTQYQIVQGIIKCTNTSAFTLGIHLFDDGSTDWTNVAIVPQGLWYSVKEFGRRT